MEFCCSYLSSLYNLNALLIIYVRNQALSSKQDCHLIHAQKSHSLGFISMQFWAGVKQFLAQNFLQQEQVRNGSMNAFFVYRRLQMMQDWECPQPLIADRILQNTPTIFLLSLIFFFLDNPLPFFFFLGILSWYSNLVVRCQSAEDGEPTSKSRHQWKYVTLASSKTITQRYRRRCRYISIVPSKY